MVKGKCSVNGATMPSGYEKSPDYGGEPPDLRAVIAGVVAFVALLALMNWFFNPPKSCWTLGQDEITISEVDGKQRATLDLRRIPEGECVTINTSKPTGRPSQGLPVN